MKRHESKYILSQPARRPLRIFASDPMLANSPSNRITIDVPNEYLRPGPLGSRFEVVDYDSANECFYPPVDLNDRAILMQNGLEPNESDPRFHQQMVYAVAMRTLENYERALGRRLNFSSGSTNTQVTHSRLRLLPHAFQGANAFYEPKLNAILFGYFKADRQNPGPNLPGQVVFTCLSHDVIVHELTHAIVHRQRPYFLEPSNPDVLAFHEGFSDIIALFQHFTFQEFLRDEIQKTHTDIREGKLLVELASQFGYASGWNQSLRSAIAKKEIRLTPEMIEAHERGSVLVAAVFDAFNATYQRRIRDLVRIATGGTGTLPEGDLHPDLVNRIATEASRTALAVLTMCIRAFDYLPPVDITFGDFLRALVTADYELNPGDESGLRQAMIEAFRARGIYPVGVASLAEESLIWDYTPNLWLSINQPLLANEIMQASETFSLDPFEQSDDNRSWGSYSSEAGDELRTELATSLHAYAEANARELYLDPAFKISVKSFHTVFRVSPRGQLLTELVVQFTQQNLTIHDDLGGIPFRGGTTIIAGIDGRVRYVISKPINSQFFGDSISHGADMRLQKQLEYLQKSDLVDAQLPYAGPDYVNDRAKLRMRFASLHRGVSA